MSNLSKEPLLSLPKDLQEKRYALRKQKDEIEEQIKKITEEIQECRRTCKHTWPKDLTGHEFAVYCTKCGEMIDSWL